MAYNIGLNVVEVDGAGAPAIVGAAASIAAFNILTQRGIPDRPVRVTSFAQFVDQFGSFFPGGFGAYMVKGFFDNGGQTAYINRVAAAEGGQAAFRVLDDTDGQPTLRVEAGFRGQRDPGEWGGSLLVSVEPFGSLTRILETERASVQGSALPETTNMTTANFPPLTVRIDGRDPEDITLQASDFADPTAATRLEIRDAINRRNTGVEASLSNDNRLVLTSSGRFATEGFSSIQITAANATLGFPSAAAQPTLGTAANLAARSTRLSSTDILDLGDAVEISDGTRTGFVKVTRIVPTTNTVEWTPSLANNTQYDERLTTVRPVRFNMNVARRQRDEDVALESHLNLSMESDSPRYAPSVINDPIGGSRYITVTDERSPSPSGANAPADAAPALLADGRDGTPTERDFIGDSARKTGFYAFDPADIQLLTCERTDEAIVKTAIAYCAGRGDCMYIGTVPEGYVALGQAGAYGKRLQGKKVFAALYGPWIKIFDSLASGANPSRFVPPTGHIMGVYARIESTRGIWKAPAGDEAYIAGALDIEYQLSDTDHTDLVKNSSVNGIRAVPGAGIVIDSSRTLSTDARWFYVNVRLLFNYVKSSLKNGLRWVRQEPNRDTLWDAIKYSAVTPFLMGLWRQGAFGTGKPDEVFTVICDATNNPPQEVDQGNLKIEVYFYPSRPAETIVIIVGQRPSGASVSEG